ncbi:MAG: M20/M25/M40 family metallo-hydrolase [Opitutales bacterium]|nr:M20/M25/M40 family metallo-hydrolase [Opitutales bacterium]
MIKKSELKTILEHLLKNRDELHKLREIVLANAVMIGEIPAPSFSEAGRARFLLDRFTEGGLQNISCDEAGNPTAVLPGSNGKENILISAHVDTEFEAGVDHTMHVSTDRINGFGIADNSLGVAVMASLPTILERLGIRLKHNLVLLGAVKSLGKGDLEGLRFFINHTPLTFKSALCLEGVHLGRLSYSCLGMMRGEISCTVENVASGDASIAIMTLTKIISRMMSIPLPQSPKTSIILGSISGGKTYGKPATKARLKFEIRSEQTGMIGDILRTIQAIVDEMDSEELVHVSVKVISRNKTGGIDFTHPLVETARTIMKELGIKARMAPSVGDLSAIIAKGIPALTLGLTSGSKKEDDFEYVDIDPLFTGIAQVLAVICAIDGGICDEID